MNYLTAVQVLFIHTRIIEETGGRHGVREVGLLESAVARPLATFGGADLYPDLFTKAAALLDSLLRDHPFVDGNKRTAIAAAAVFLRRNGWRLTASNEELATFTLAIAQAARPLSDLAAWLEAHCVPGPPAGSP